MRNGYKRFINWLWTHVGARSDTRFTSNDGKSIFRAITSDSTSVYRIQLQSSAPADVIELRHCWRIVMSNRTPWIVPLNDKESLFLFTYVHKFSISVQLNVKNNDNEVQGVAETGPLAKEVRRKKHISQGSVATCLISGGIFIDSFLINLLPSVVMKEFWKLSLIFAKLWASVWCMFLTLSALFYSPPCSSIAGNSRYITSQ